MKLEVGKQYSPADKGKQLHCWFKNKYFLMNQNIINLIFSKAAAERICNLPPFSIQEIKFNETGWIDVIVNKEHTIVIQPEIFYQHFANIRKERSKTIAIETTQYSNLFTAINTQNNNKYYLRTTKTGIECKCRDFQKQQEILSKGCCKHGYALLGQLGYENLRSYIKAKQNISTTPIDILPQLNATAL